MKKLLSILLIGAAFTGCSDEKTAYVDTARLLQEYSEMKAVETEFTERSQALRSQLDSVAQTFQAEVMAFEERSASMNATQLEEARNELMAKQQRLQQNQQMLSNSLRTESEGAIDSLVTKVKDFVEAYGEKNNYTYIFGSTEMANIMYAKEGLDITDEVLEELNASVE